MDYIVKKVDEKWELINLDKIVFYPDKLANKVARQLMWLDNKVDMFEIKVGGK